MKIQKLESTDAFIAFDLDDAPAAGVTRLARKVLQDGAVLLARSTTYSFASFGLPMGGGSAGINAEGDGIQAAVAAFVDETTALVSGGRWVTDPGLGLTDDDLGGLRSVDQRPAELWTDGLATTLTAEGAVAAAGAALPSGLAGVTWSAVGGGPLVEAAKIALTRDGALAAPGAGGAESECDVLFVAGKAGVVDHDVAETVQASVVVPLTAVPVTARAHAILTRAGRIHVPDFLTIAAPLLRAHDADGGDPIDRVRGAVADLASEGTRMWMAAAEKAEAHLMTWQPTLPSFRPLA